MEKLCLSFLELSFVYLTIQHWDVLGVAHGQYTVGLVIHYIYSQDWKPSLPSLQLNSVFQLAAVGPVSCHSTVTVSPVTVTPSLIRCREHTLCEMKCMKQGIMSSTNANSWSFSSNFSLVWLIDEPIRRPLSSVMATSPLLRVPMTVSISGCSRLFTVKLTEPEEPVGKKEE